MRKLRTTTLIACVVLLATASVASASSHGGMPAGMSFMQVVQWEIDHFMIHMQLTFQAIQLWFVSPELGWSLLDSQSLCADQGHLTAHLFDTATHALMTFIDCMLIGVLLMIEIAVRVWRYIAAFTQRPSYGIAQL